MRTLVIMRGTRSSSHSRSAKHLGASSTHLSTAQLPDFLRKNETPGLVVFLARTASLGFKDWGGIFGEDGLLGFVKNTVVQVGRSEERLDKMLIGPDMYVCHNTMGWPVWSKMCRCCLECSCEVRVDRSQKQLIMHISLRCLPSRQLVFHSPDSRCCLPVQLGTSRSFRLQQVPLGSILVSSSSSRH